MSQTKTLDQWLVELERNHPVAIDLGLERIEPVARRMGLFDGKIASKVITVAGTNGKGSTVAMIEALALSHGLGCASYTSPHLFKYNERVRLDGAPVDDATLVMAFECVDAARDGISLTYFEAGTLAALHVFKTRAPDIAVLEVGLGGRLDAVNIIDPDVAVVTTVDRDHAAFLGTDLEQIGLEKAGILRKGAPAVLGSKTLPASVARYAQTLGAAPVYQLESQFRRTDADERGRWHWQGLDRHGERLGLSELIDPGLPLDNAATALQAFSLAHEPLSADAIAQALGRITLPGRMQWLERGGRRWCLDVAHNPHAARYVAGQLVRQPGPRLGVLAMLSDKDAAAVVAELEGVIDGWILAGLDGDRARTGDELAEVVRASGARVIGTHDDVSSAIASLSVSKGADEFEAASVLVCGSFFTVAEALTALGHERIGQ
ncbi:bifunctional tetrahydrofolate synthase/dihydrofolate synthase [Larsenimonas suaedae]|uniref:Dihydrofolate synthase/folylpolyglutamate synthase n=1 Tax=Larsenimonas suaedae TaxID=1851019 RepID=A0ABU1GXB8_9GAMM|nr:bifunctional tetrahydrofolate synthase/dihydrofolate synthase [Larsenimonas suaedae]MCM2971433.1 bifunctional tetrahydrofolate synthase/dihydrofolate synthase [Larsenimonas suaedae]MDR5896689.1 bifunctional tetrahydrofolate synthase/dihydrofolate synthase [Larsenimonas suaedae]